MRNEMEQSVTKQRPDCHSDHNGHKESIYQILGFQHREQADTGEGGNAHDEDSYDAKAPTFNVKTSRLY